jgi:SNF2 family DNA or RNA helicase
VPFVFLSISASEGGILADEMGLGKTVQAVSFLIAVFISLRKQGKLFRALLVLPKSVIENWKREINQW